jgi:hypothetical protein
MEVAAGVSAVGGNGATGRAIVCWSVGGCKTPDEGTATGAGGGAARIPDDGYSAMAKGRTSDSPDSGIVSGACVTTRSHQGACKTYSSRIWPRAEDRAAVSTITGAIMHALLFTRRPDPTNFPNLNVRGQWAFRWGAKPDQSGLPA